MLRYTALCSCTRVLRMFFACFSLSMLQLAQAEDIEVYGSSFGVTSKPNVLFVIDSSDSMEYGTDGAPASWPDRKIDILRQVIADVLADSRGKINAGVSFFSSATSGIKWPVSDLTLEAGSIDPGIPAGILVEDVLVSEVGSYGTWGRTNYLSGLSEAARYFRGEAVWYNNWLWPTSAVPESWDNGAGQYTSGAGMSPNRYTYLPLDAYVPGGGGPDPKTQQCDNYKYFDSSASNYCDGLPLTSTDLSSACTTIAGYSYNYTECDSSYVCTDDLGQGECGQWTCSGSMVTKTETVADRLQCDYYVGSWVVPDYQTPIGAACQGNFIILLSDGIPTVMDQPDAALSLLGYASTTECVDVSASIFGDSTHTEGNCSADLLRYLKENDQIPGLTPSTVRTYTVGFGLVGLDATIGKNYLMHLASEGGGKFFEADNYSTLTDSLKSIINAITGEADEFTGLAIDVRSDAFTSDNRAFVNLFTPSEKRVWEGNLKGYFLEASGLKDVDGSSALDSYSKFLPDARSFWSDSPDGGIVADGGVTEKLQAGGRTLYTYTGSVEPNDILLETSSKEHYLDVANSALTKSMLAVPDETLRTDILNWIQTAPMSDPLHSKPLIAHYPSGEVLYTMTNQGFVHAVDVSNPKNYHDYSGGDEIFAFMPQELLPNLSAIKTNLTTGTHIYGLDGNMTLRHDDTDSDFLIDAGETAILYFGMRRGGSHYYALDVSDVTAPRLLWKISAGVGEFADLGQTWSKMTLTTVRDGGSAKKVLIFGGGYDLAEDAKTSRSSGIGNRVYMVDADDGQLIWSVGAGSPHLGASQMQYSIPSDITTIDLNGNGYADRLYFGDMGGQVWRVNFDEGVSGGSAPATDFDFSDSVTLLADFGSSENRRFFYPPAVALMSSGGEKYLSISLGSGNRAHPLDESVQDWLFMIRDPLDSPLSSTLSMTDLYDATDNLILEGTDTASEKSQLKAADGWKMKLESGEKSLSTLVAFGGKLRFTTYEPVTTVALTCGSGAGSIARYYVLNLDDATPASDSAGTDESSLTKNDRSREIESFGIASSPVLAFLPDSDSVNVFVGKENVGNITSRLNRIYWRQDQ